MQGSDSFNRSNLGEYLDFVKGSDPVSQIGRVMVPSYGDYGR